jgi:D-alanine transaminase
VTNESTSEWVSIDGRPSPLAQARLPIDRGLLRADGCFETALVVGDEVVALDRHLSRLGASLVALRVVAGSAPGALIDALGADIRRLIEAAPPCQDERVMRVTATSALRLIELSPLPERVSLRRRGVALHTLGEARHESLSARHKTLAWAVHAFASRLHPHGTGPAFEGLWLDPDGFVLEGTATNVFALFEDGIRTPPTTRPILPGTARARAIEALRTRGVAVEERDFSAASLAMARGAFVTSALTLAAPVLSLDGAELEAPPGDLIAELRRALLAR